MAGNTGGSQTHRETQGNDFQNKTGKPKSKKTQNLKNFALGVNKGILIRILKTPAQLQTRWELNDGDANKTIKKQVYYNNQGNKGFVRKKEKLNRGPQQGLGHVFSFVYVWTTITYHNNNIGNCTLCWVIQRCGESALQRQRSLIMALLIHVTDGLKPCLLLYKPFP